jgi:hypothetical protein
MLESKLDNIKPNNTVSGSQDEVSLYAILRSLIFFFKFLLSKKMILISAAVIGMLIGVIISYVSKPKYTALSTFVLEEVSGSGGLGQYAGIASMMGVDLSGSGGDGIFKGDNLLELYKSNLMIQRALLSKVDINGIRRLLIDRYIEINNLKVKWNDNKRLSDINFEDMLNGKHTRLQDSLLHEFVADINKNYLTVSRPDKKLEIIVVNVTSKDEVFAKLFNDQIVKTVNDFYVATKTKKSLTNLNVLQHQTDSIRSALNSAIYNVASSTDINPNANLSRLILRVPTQKRQIDAEANKAILTELVKNLELSKVTLRKETPLIQIIDKPVYPLRREKIGRIKGGVIGGLLGIILSIFYLAVTRIINIANNTNYA